MTVTANTNMVHFIPEVWSKKLEKIFDKLVVMTKLVNTDHEGEIKSAGDTVNVRTYGSVTVNDYTRDTAIDFQGLTPSLQTMSINQQKYFAFHVDDLDQAQADINILEGHTGRAAIAIRDVIDTRLLSHYADVAGANAIGTSAAPMSVTPDNVYNYFVDLGQKLDDANIGPEGRWAVVAPKIKSALLKSPEFTRATAMGDQTVKTGMIGEIAGFNVHLSTNVPTVSSAKPLLVGTRDFISYASQVSKVEHVRPYDRFADAVKGLYLYGSKVFTNCSYAGAVLWFEA